MQRITKLTLATALIASAPLAASARSSYLTTFDSTYKTSGTVLDSCSTCHGSGGTSTWNAYGQELRNSIGAGQTLSQALTVAEPKDSDGDGFSNLDEIKALTFPGDAKSVPAATSAPKIAVAPTSLSLGTVAVGKSASQTTKISNAGTADLTISAVARCSGTSAEFAASPSGSFTVAPGGSQTVTVTYTPVDATVDTGCVAIANNDASAGTVNVTVTGTGQAAPAAVLDVDITRLSVAKKLDVSRGGTTKPTVAVVNAGTVAGTATVHLEGTAPDASGAPVVVYTASQDVTLAPAGTAKIGFPVFAATAPETVTWTATVADADPDVDTATATTKVVP